jgi:hypothetical protein
MLLKQFKLSEIKRMDTVVDATGQRFRTASGKDYTEWTFFALLGTIENSSTCKTPCQQSIKINVLFTKNLF